MEEFWGAVEHFAAGLKKSTAVNVNAQSLRDEARALAQMWFRQGRAEGIRHGFEESTFADIDRLLHRINTLAVGRNPKSAYTRAVRELKTLRPTLEARALQLHSELATKGNGVGTSQVEDGIVNTLAQMLPVSAAGYRQVLIDLSGEARLSYRGTATELREVVREVLDHLAPDKDVIASPGFKFEKDRRAPTMKQKARFILKARGIGESTRTAPEQAVEMLELQIAGLARSVYERGSASTHGATTRVQCLTFKGFADAVLAELLQVHGA